MLDQHRDYVLRTVEERGVRLVRLWFTDVLGNLKSFAISPAELENALVAHEAIGQVAVVGLLDARMGEVPVAYVVPAAGAGIDSDAGSEDWRKIKKQYRKTGSQ